MQVEKCLTGVRVFLHNKQDFRVFGVAILRGADVPHCFLGKLRRKMTEKYQKHWFTLMQMTAQSARLQPQARNRVAHNFLGQRTVFQHPDFSVEISRQ